MAGAPGPPIRWRFSKGSTKSPRGSLTLTVPVDREVRFGSLWITPRACHKKPPEEAPEAAAFLEIDQQNPNEPRLALMRGWVFASSRGLNALEHPVYDVWLVDCKNAPTADQAPSSG